MTLAIPESSNFSVSTIDSESLPTVRTVGVPRAPTTDRAVVMRWETLFRSQDVPVPDGFDDIDDVVARREAEPDSARALERARQRLAQKMAAGEPGLAALRLQKGWSQKRLAAAIGTSQPHIARIENGRDNVLLATANQIAAALETTLEHINRALGYGRK